METSDEKKVRLDGNWLSMADAAKRTPYSAEYLSLLARKGKLVAKKIDNVWYTTKDLLQSYMDRQMMRVEIQNGTISPRGGSADEPLRNVRTFESDVAEIMAAKRRFEQQASFANDAAVLERRFDKDMSEPAPHTISPKLTAVESSIPSISPSESIVPLASEMKRISSSIEHISKKIESISLPQASTHEPLERLYEKFDQFVDRKIESKHGVVSKMHGSVLESFVTVARRKHLLMIVIVLLGILAVFPIPFVNALFERSFGLVKDLWGDANTVMGFRPGTHANEILLLDKEGNISLYGHVETEGQLRSFIEDGLAPIVVESTTLVENLNAEYLGGLQGKDFTLAFVTKNGNVTTEDVYLEGKVEVGKTLLVKGASKLLSSLSVDGSLGVLGDATFKKGITVEGPSRFKALMQAHSIDAAGVVKGQSLIAEGGVFGAEVSASRALSTDGNLTVKGQSNFGGFAFFNRGLQASTGDFADALSVGGSFGVAGDVSLGTLGNKTLRVSMRNIALNADGNLTVSGSITSQATTTSSFGGRFEVGRDVSATFFSATDSSATSTFAGITAGAGRFVVDAASGKLALGTTTKSNAQLGVWGTGNLIEVSDTASTTLFVVQSSGNVGIGTTSPSQKLGVGGDVYVAGTVSADAFVATTSLSGPFFQATDSAATSTFKGDILVKGLAAWSYLTSPTIRATSTTATSTFAGAVSVSGTTSLSELLLTGSTTLQNLTFLHATGTSATTTSFFATTASSTNLYATTGSIGTLSVNTGSFTSLAVSGLGRHMLLTTDASGNLVASSTPTAAYYLATSSIASVFPYASTTALSSSGSAYFATTGGNVGIGTTSPSQTLSIHGNLYTSGTSFFGGAITATSTLNVTGLTTFVNGFISQASSTVASTLRVSDGFFASSTLHATGATRLYGTLTTDGAATFSSTLGVTNLSTLSGGFLSLASSTLQNFTAVNSTSTSATTTNLFATNLQATNLIFTNQIVTNSTSTNATTTNLAISSLTSGRIPYASTGGNIIDNAALTFDGTKFVTTYASTTAISSTGSAYFATTGGNVGIGTTEPSAKLYVEGGGIGVNTASDALYTVSDLLLGTANGGTTIRLRIGGSEKVRIDGNGNLGVGTTTPRALLAVQGNALISGNLSVAAITATSSTITFSGLGTNMLTSINNSGNLVATSTPTAAYYLATSSIASVFPYASSTALTVSGTGYFGTASTTNLTVSSLTSTRIPFITTNGAFTDDADLTFTNGNLLTATYASTTAISSTGSAYFATTGGNVGIGTTSPTSILAIQGTTPTLSIKNAGASQVGSLSFFGFDGLTMGGISANASSGEIRYGAFSTNYFPTFYSNNSEVMRITTVGNLGIGTTSPNWKFSVAGTGSFDDYVRTSYFTATSTTATSTFAGFIDVNGTGTNATSTFASNLWVKGALQVGTGSTYINTNSIAFSAAGAITTGTGALSLTPAAGSNLNVNLSTTGDFAVNTSQLYVDTSAGFVGVGTASPVYKLDVAGTTALAGAGTANNGFYTILGTYANARALIEVKHDTTTNTADGLDIAKWGGTQLARFATSNSYILGGNVGIGTTDPSTAKLVIDTASNTSGLRLLGTAETTEIADIYVGSTGQLVLSTASTGDTDAYIEADAEDNDFGFIIRDSSTGSSVYANLYMNDAATDYLNIVAGAANSTAGLVIQTGGNVGIGTSGPLGKIHSYIADDGLAVDANLDSQSALIVENSSSVWQQFRKPNSAYGGLVFNEGTDSDGAQFRYAWTGTAATSGFEFRGNASELMRVTSAGNVGIGTTSPVAKLSISNAGDAFVNIDSQSGSNSSGIFFTGASNNQFGIRTNSNGLNIVTGNYSSNSAVVTVNSSGNLGIGTTSPHARFAVDGGGGTYITSGGLVGIGTNVFGTGDKLKVAATSETTLFAHIDGSTSSSDGNASVKLTKKATASNANVEFWTTSTQDWVLGTGITATDANFRLYAGTGQAVLTAEKSGAVSNTLYLKAGNVGIGTTAPGGKLEIKQGSEAATHGLWLTRSSEATSMKLYMNSSLGGLSDPLVFSSTLSGDVAAIGRDGKAYFASNVGIGSTSPAALLAVAANGSGDSAYFAGEVGIGTNVPAYKLDLYDPGTSGLHIRFRDSEATNGSFLGISSDGNFYMQNQDNAGLVFVANNGEKMRIEAGGDVGVGTTNPDNLFVVHGGTNETAISIEAQDVFAGVGFNRSVRDGTIYDSGTGAFQLHLQSGDLEYEVYNSAGSLVKDSALVVDGTTGGVGIGTGGVESGNALDVYTSGADPSTQIQIRAERTSYGNIRGTLKTYAAGAATSNYFKMGIDTGNIILDSGGSVDQFILTHAGNVGIGTTAPDSKLEVAGTIISGARMKIEGTGAACSGENDDTAGIWYSDAGDCATVFAGINSSTNGAESWGIWLGNWDWLVDVNGNVTNTGTLTVQGSGGITLTNTSPYSVIKDSDSLASSNAVVGYVSLQDSAGTEYGWMGDGSGSDNYVQIHGGTTHGLQLGAGGADRFTIDTSGNVGIDTVSNFGKLTVKVDADTYVDGYTLQNTDGSNYFSMGLDSGGHTTFWTYNGTDSWVKRMTLRNNGNLGIGTTTPGAKLEVAGASAQLRIHDTDVSNVFWSLGTDNNADFAIWENTVTNANNRLMIKSGGNVGIGTTSPHTLFAVNQTAGGGFYVPSGGNVGIGMTAPTSMLGIRNSSNRAVDIYTPGSTDGNGSNLVWTTDTTGSTKADIAYFGAVQDGATQQSGKFYWQVGNSGAPGVVMTLTKAGNLGIGELAPGSKLAVSGGATIGASYDTTAAPTNGLLVEGNVGVGETSPDTKLHLSQAGTANTLHPTLTSQVTGSFTAAQRVGLGSVIKFQNDTNVEYAQIGAYCASDCTNNQSQLGFWTENTATTFTTSNPQMVINSLGNVGIGVTTVSAALQVGAGTPSFAGSGDIYSPNDIEVDSVVYTPNIRPTVSNGTIRISDDSGLATRALTINNGGGATVSALDSTYTPFDVQVGGTSVARFTGAGNLGIGTTSPMGKLAVTSDASSPGLVIDRPVLDSNNRDAIYLTEDDGQASGKQSISWYNANQSYYKARLWTEVGSGYGATTFGIDVANDARTVDTRLAIRNGNVGIGTASPANEFNLLRAGASGVNAVFDNSTNSSGAHMGVWSRVAGTSAGDPKFLLSVTGGDTWTMGVDNSDSDKFVIAASTDLDTSRAMTITTAGNVGIGNTSPGTKLDVSGIARFGSAAERPAIGGYTDSYTGMYSVITSNNHGDFTFGNNLTILTDHTLNTTNTHSTLGGAAIVLGGNAYNNGASSINFFTQSGAATAGTIVSPSQASMVIKAGGNVGIGDTSPVGKLQIGNNVATSYLDNFSEYQVVLYENATAADSYGFGVRGDTLVLNSDNDFAFDIGSATNMIIKGTGNVGIGTTSPDALLSVHKVYNDGSDSSDVHVATFATNRQTFGATANWAGHMKFVSGGVNDYAEHARMTWDGNNKLYFSTGTSGAKRMTIDGSGNVGIGTTTPSATLDVYNTSGNTLALSKSTNAPNILIDGGSSNKYFIDIDGGTNGNLRFAKNDNSAIMTLLQSGNVGIGTTPSVKLHVSGVHTAGRGIVEIGSSDDALIAMRKGAGTAGLRIQNSSGTDQWFVGENSSNVLTIDRSFGGAVEFSVDTNGNVGIGTGAPAAVLDIQTAAGTFRQKGFTTVVTDRLDASAAQARRFEIARAAIDYNDWNSVGSIEIELHEKYWSGGLKKKYVVWYGYVSDAGVYLAEITGKGGNNNFQVTIGAEVVISGDNRYIPIYVDVDEYAQVIAVIRTNRDLTSSNPPAIGAIYVNASPTGSNIADFTADSVVTVNKGYNSYFDNKVGIAVATPQYALDVDVAANTMASIGSNSNTNGNWSGLHVGYREDTNALYRKAGIAFETIGDGAARGKLHLFNDGTNDSSSGNGVTDARLTINYDGNVGIGTTSPSEKLTVYGAVIRLEGAGLTPFAIANNNSTGFRIYDYTAGLDRVVINTSGNVGINTTGPRGKLDVSGINSELYVGNSGDQAAVIGNTRRVNYGDLMIAKNLGGVTGADTYRTIATSAATGYAGIEFKYGGDVAVYGASGATTADAVVSPSARLYVQGSTGYVGVGTASPNSKLDVVGRVDVGHGAESYGLINWAASDINNSSYMFLGMSNEAGWFKIGTNKNGTGTQRGIAFNTGGSESASAARMVIDTNGNVGIGTSAPTAPLHVAGGTSVTGTIKGSYGIMFSSRDEWLRLNDDDGGGDYHTSGVYLDGPGVGIQGGLIVGGSGYGAAGTITGTVLNGTTGINTGSGSGTQRIDASGNLVNINSLTLGDLTYSASQSISLALGTEAWVKLATFSNRSYAKIRFGIGSTNSEEEGEIEIGTTYTTSLSLINVTRQTYNARLSEVRVTGADGGAKTVYVKIRTSDFAPTVTWRIVESKNFNTIHNIEETPGSGASLVVNGNQTVSTSGAMNIAGNVGIGTTAPGGKLEIKQGSEAATHGLWLTRSSEATSMKLYMNSSLGGLSDPLVFSSTLSGDVAAIGRDGKAYFASNVGIGTTSPASNLAVTGTGYFTTSVGVNVSVPAAMFHGKTASSASAGGLRVDSGSVQTLVASYGDGAYGYGGTISNSAYHTITNNTIRTTVNTDGNLGVGVLSPGYKLSVSFGLSEGNTLQLNDSDGNCLIDPDAGGLNTTCTSDGRLKTNVVDAQSQLSYIANIPLREYDVISSGTHLLGVIAQELISSGYEELVTMGEDGFYGVRELSSWQLIKGIQEIGQRVGISLSAPTTTPSLYIDATGNIGLGTTSPAYKLHVEGDVAATAFVNISTKAAKKDVEYLDDAQKTTILEKLKNVGIATYNYNFETCTSRSNLEQGSTLETATSTQEITMNGKPVTDRKDGSCVTRLGLIAEESPAEVLSANGKGVDVYKLATFILAGVQEQQKNVEALTLRVEDLEKKVAAMTATSTATVTDSSFKSSVIGFVLEHLESLGVKFANGVAYIKTAVVDSISTKALVIGSENERTGITMYDEVDGKPYCLSVANGVTKTTQGACEVKTGSGQTLDTTPPVIEIQGNNPAHISIGSTYADLGALVSDNVNQNLGYKVRVNGAEVSEISLDTASSTTYTIEYVATDAAGNAAVAARTVIVGESQQSATTSTGTETQTSNQTQTTAAQPSTTSTQTASSTPQTTSSEPSSSTATSTESTSNTSTSTSSTTETTDTQSGAETSATGTTTPSSTVSQTESSSTTPSTI